MAFDSFSDSAIFQLQPGSEKPTCQTPRYSIFYGMILIIYTCSGTTRPVRENRRPAALTSSGSIHSAALLSEHLKSVFAKRNLIDIR